MFSWNKLDPAGGYLLEACQEMSKCEMWKQRAFNVGRDEKDEYVELQFGSFKHLTTKYEAVFSLFHATWKKGYIRFARGWYAAGLTEKACTQKNSL